MNSSRTRIVAQWLLATAFAVAGTLKLLEGPTRLFLLQRSIEIHAATADFASRAVQVVECALAAWIAIGFGRRCAAMVALLVLVGFSCVLAILAAKFGASYECACAPGVGPTHVGGAILRNIFLITLSVLLLMPDTPLRTAEPAVVPN